MIRHTVLVLVFCLAWTPAGFADCVFVNTNSQSNTVAAFEVQPDGSLAPVTGSPFPTGGSGGLNANVGSVGLSAFFSRLYVTNSNSASVSGFDVAPDCSLTPLPGSPYGAGGAGARPVGLDVHPSGAFLYVSNFAGGDVSVLTVADDGSLSEIPGSPFDTPDSPFDVHFDPSNDHLFVSHDFADSIGVYEPAPDGTLTPVPGSPFSAGGTQHGLVLNPSGTRLYATDLRTRTITGYSVGTGAGLTPLAQSPYSTGVVPIELVVDFADRYLYVTHNFGNSIGGFAIDENGDLTPLPGSPFRSDSVGPAGLAQDPAGRFLFVANGGYFGRPDVSVYSVSVDGSITPIAGSPFPTGGTGQATGIVYFRRLADPSAIPTLGAWGMRLLVISLLLLGVGLLRWRGA